jgi:tripartite-type tricarboxylate transporter receptor subunit TctC
VTQTAEDEDFMDRQALKPIDHTGKALRKVLAEDETRIQNLMTEAGFVAN